MGRFELARGWGGVVLRVGEVFSFMSSRERSHFMSGVKSKISSINKTSKKQKCSLFFTPAFCVLGVLPLFFFDSASSPKLMIGQIS